ASALACAAQLSPSLWFIPTCDALGPPVLALVGGAAISASALPLLGSRADWRVRLCGAAVAGATVAGAVVLAFPACVDGPYGLVPEPYRTMWLHNIPEARSFLETMAIEPGIAWATLGPMVAVLAAAVMGALRLRGMGQRLMLACAVALAISSLL